MLLWDLCPVLISQVELLGSLLLIYLTRLSVVHCLQHHYIPSQQPPVHLLIPRHPGVLSPSSRAAYLIYQIISKPVKYGIVHIFSSS